MIDFRVLGTLELRTSERSEVRSVLSQPKRVALLTYLAVHAPGGFVRRDTLLALFWPESDTERARGSLRRALHALRQALGEGVVAARGAEEVGVDPALLVCDAAAFLRALEAGAWAEALTLYRGDLLEGFFLSGVPGFEQWLEEERTRLRERAVGAAWALALEAEENGDAEGAARFGRRAVALARDEEPAVRKLIALLGRVGHPAGALRVYEEFAERLTREYDLSPSAETRALVEALRAAPAAPEPRPASPSPSASRGEGSMAHLAAAEEHDPGAEQSPLSRKRERRSGGEGRRLRVFALLALVLVIGSAALLPRLRSAPAVPVSPDLVAVLPFTYHGSAAYAYLTEGMVRLLSTNLDGVGELRAVDPRALLGRAEQTGARADDPGSGRALAEHFGAGLVVLGHIIEAGGRLRITAVIYERSRPGQPVGEITVEGEGSQLFELVDQLTAGLLAARSAEPRVRLERIASLTTHSIPALKVFLEGEREYRAGRYGAAVEAFREAAELDTTFALAHFRLAATAIWIGDGELQDRGRERAKHYRDRLPPRDRWLLELPQSLTGASELLYQAVLQRYPDDVEAWYLFADERFHWGPLFGHSVLDSRAAFERVLGYEPTHAGALMHLARLAALERRTTELDSLLERFARIGAAPDQLLEMQALRVHLENDRAERARLQAQLLAPGGASLGRLSRNVAVFANDFAGGAALLRLGMPAPRDSIALVIAHLDLAAMALAAGQVGLMRREMAAAEALAPVSTLGLRTAATILPSLLPSPDELRTLRDEVLRAPAASGWAKVARTPRVLHLPGQRYLLGVLSARMGDPLAALGYAAELQRLSDPTDAPLGRAYARIVRAEVARVGGQPAEALALLGELRPPLDYELPYEWRFVNAGERWLRAELLRELARYEEALRWYASFPSPEIHDLIYLAPSHLRRAEIHERRGEREKAAEHYRRFVELWQDADPELQPLVAQARQRGSRSAAAP